MACSIYPQYVVHNREFLKVQKELRKIQSSRSEAISEDEAEERKAAIGQLEADLEAAHQNLQMSKNQEQELRLLPISFETYRPS